MNWVEGQGNMVVLLVGVWLEQVEMEVLENRIEMMVGRMEVLNREGELV